MEFERNFSKSITKDNQESQLKNPLAVVLRSFSGGRGRRWRPSSVFSFKKGVLDLS